MPRDCGTEKARRIGGFKELVADAPCLEPQSTNIIKKCPKCGKPNAVSMKVCNACNADVSSVPESTTPNLFVGMIFGVPEAPFPLRISLRAETENIMVFDDPLAITRCHVLSVPTDVYVPDIRSLFVNPAAGLDLVKRLEEAAWAAILAGHLSSEVWRRKAMSPAGCEEDLSIIRSRVMSAFNVPPSQYQLHLQYMLPPVLPSHYRIWKRHGHFVEMRHFPFLYVVASLEALVAAKKALPGAPKMTTTELVESLAAYGVDYDVAYRKDMENFAQSNALLANFDAADFKYALGDDESVLSKFGGELLGHDAPSIQAVEATDKLSMQGYGRPYRADGKPGGTFYSYARDPGALPLLS